MGGYFDGSLTEQERSYEIHVKQIWKKHRRNQSPIGGRE